MKDSDCQKLDLPKSVTVQIQLTVKLSSRACGFPLVLAILLDSRLQVATAEHEVGVDVDVGRSFHGEFHLLEFI